jgi:hypothetical protein
MPVGIAHGSGIIQWGSDFTGIFDGHGQANSGVIATGGENLEGGIGLIAVNEGSYASTFDETGGILALTTDTGNDDNNCLVAGVFSPRDGKMVVRTRFKYSNLDCAIFVGFAETLDIGTPVMPAEFATLTMTYNPGGMIGLQYDVDGTTDDFRAVMGDGSAAISDSSNGIRANATVTADRWFEAEVILNEDGSGECWLGESGNANALLMNKLSLVKRFSAGTLVTTTDVFYAVLMIENRTANARVLETDYFAGSAGRDWRY